MQFHKSILGQLKNMNIWHKVIGLVTAISLVLIILISYIGKEYIFKDQILNEKRKNLSVAAHELEVHFLPQRLITENFAYEYKSHQIGDLDKVFKDTLENYQDEEVSLEFINILDKKGNLLWSSNNKEVKKGNYTQLEVVKHVLTGKEVTGFEILPEEITDAENLNNKTHLPITNKAKGTKQLKVGLTHVTGIPLFGKDKQLQAVVVSGVIINGNDNIVKEISHTIGTPITIFANNISVASTEKDQAGRLLIGNEIPFQIVKVIGKGKEFLGEVENNDSQYLTAYQPIKDLENKVIGAIRVSADQGPMLEALSSYKLKLYSLIGVVGLLLVLLIWWLYQTIVKGILVITKGVKTVTKGNFAARIASPKHGGWVMVNCRHSCDSLSEPDHPCVFEADRVDYETLKNKCPICKVEEEDLGNEVSLLANVFNYMAVSIEERERQLSSVNSELETRNQELIVQQEELQSQQGELEAQSEELMAQQEELLAQQDQLMFVNEQLAKSIQELDNLHDIIYSLALAIEAKDKYTRGHSERVASYAKKLANKLGFTAQEVQLIEGAGILHDIGKIGVSESILHKPGSLTKDEFNQIKEHPDIGANICQTLKSAKDIVPIIRHHHERYDGGGYPDGLEGENIPLMARIMAVVDAYDAMTTDRPYRAGMEKKEAVDILINGSGKQWDPKLVPIFLKILNEEKDA